MERAGLGVRAVPQLRPHLIEQRVADLVRNHVGARAGPGGLPARGVMEERDTAPVIVRVEIHAVVGQQVDLAGRPKPVFDLPAAQRFERLNGRQGCLATLPKQKLRITQWMLRCGRVRHVGKAGNGAWPLRARRLRPRRRPALGPRIVGDECDRHR